MASGETTCFLKSAVPGWVSTDELLIERPMKNILVLCTGNSCRSQMAEGYLNAFHNTWAVVYSAGIESHGLNPDAVAVMKEDGVDISHHTSNTVADYKDVKWTYIITVCDHAKEHCPYIPSPDAIRMHRNFPDPSKVTGTKNEKQEAFIAVRDQIREFCAKFPIQEVL